MNFEPFTTAELTRDKPVTSTVLNKIRNNLEWVRSAFTYNLTEIANGDFECVTDEKPDLWTCTTYEGGYVGVSTISFSGQYALHIEHDGGTRSGGQAVSEYIPICTGVYYHVQAVRYGDALPLQIDAEFFTGSFAAAGSSQIYNSSVISTGGSGGTTYVKFNVTSFVAPANSRWMKLNIHNSTAAGATAAGNIYLDSMLLTGQIADYY